jgi:hypothetical protein
VRRIGDDHERRARLLSLRFIAFLLVGTRLVRARRRRRRRRRREQPASRRGRQQQFAKHDVQHFFFSSEAKKVPLKKSLFWCWGCHVAKREEFFISLGEIFLSLVTTLETRRRKKKKHEKHKKQRDGEEKEKEKRLRERASNRRNSFFAFSDIFML